MPYDGMLLAKARKELEKIRTANEAEQIRRTNEVYSKCPEVRSADAGLRAQMAELATLTLSRAPDLTERLNELKERNLDLQMRRAEAIVAAGYPMEYLDPIYSCNKCNDTGYCDGKICSCLNTMYKQEVTRSLSSLMLSGDECFEKFDLSLYPEEAMSGLPNVRSYMGRVLEKCKKFADDFPCPGKNMLFQGKPGLGKTYLSACIAKAVSEKGYSVCYETVSDALYPFEQRSFTYDDEKAEVAEAKIQRMLGCDLMIIDDLGTEMLSSVSISALYTLINDRLLTGKQTIISTNCNDAELTRNYGQHINSRITGAYTKFPFLGYDIRVLKKRAQQ